MNRSTARALALRVLVARSPTAPPTSITASLIGRLSEPMMVSLISMISRSCQMSGSLHVRNLEDDLIARLKRRAVRHGRSTEAEHREILRQALAADIEPSFETLAAELRKLTRGRRHTPSEVLLREGRGER